MKTSTSISSLLLHRHIHTKELPDNVKAEERKPVLCLEQKCSCVHTFLRMCYITCITKVSLLP